MVLAADLLSRVAALIMDRCRIPGLFGGGAYKIPIERLFPLVLVFASVYIGSWHPIVTCLSTLFSPCAMLFYHKVKNAQQRANNSTRRQRSNVFFIWSLASLASNVVVFYGLVVVFRRILLWEHMVLFSLLAVTLRLLVEIKRDRVSTCLVQQQTNIVRSKSGELIVLLVIHVSKMYLPTESPFG